MSRTAQEIVERQNEILKAMGEIRTMRRGSMSRQTYAERAERKEGKGAVGPYHLWQGTLNGERFGKRVSGAEAEEIGKGIEQRHAFEALCEEYVALGCQLGALEHRSGPREEPLKRGL